MLGRGAMISALVCLVLVPPILVVCEPLIAHTTLGWRKPRPPRPGSKPVPAEGGEPAPSEPLPIPVFHTGSREDESGPN